MLAIQLCYTISSHFEIRTTYTIFIPITALGFDDPNYYGTAILFEVVCLSGVMHQCLQ